MLSQILIEAANAGAAQLRYYFNHPALKTTVKSGGINDLVTEADHASDKAIIEVIRTHYPDHFILSEETGNVPTQSEYKWIIDPIDGTINFAQGIPICCVSIGLEKAGEMILGAVYAPFLNEFFFAEKGKGAMLNDKPIAVSHQTELVRSCLVTGFPTVISIAPTGRCRFLNGSSARGCRYAAWAAPLSTFAGGRRKV